MPWAAPGAIFSVDFSKGTEAGSGLAMIAGIKTLDTSIIGAIVIAGLVTALHNRYFDKPLPVFLGIFQGSSFVVIVAFLAMIPCAWLTLFGWPKIQMGIESLQQFLRDAGAVGVWVYTFLERILIPTGLHHFIYGPFIFGPAVVEGGIQVYWAEHLQAFSQSTQPLKQLFPQGGFALHGNAKVFGAVGIALAIYSTASPLQRIKVAGLLIPATLTAVLVGITEPWSLPSCLFRLCCLLCTLCWPPAWRQQCICAASWGIMAAAYWTSFCRKTGYPCSLIMLAWS